MKILFTALTILLVTSLNASVYDFSYGEPIQAPQKILIVEDDMITGSLLNLMVIKYFDDKFGERPKIEISKTDKEAMKSFHISKPGLVIFDYSIYGYKKKSNIIFRIQNYSKHSIKVIAFSKSMRRSLGRYKYGVNDVKIMNKFRSLMDDAYFPNG